MLRLCCKTWLTQQLHSQQHIQALVQPSPSCSHPRHASSTAVSMCFPSILKCRRNPVAGTCTRRTSLRLKIKAIIIHHHQVITITRGAEGPRLPPLPSGHHHHQFTIFVQSSSVYSRCPYCPFISCTSSVVAGQQAYSPSPEVQRAVPSPGVQRALVCPLISHQAITITNSPSSSNHLPYSRCPYCPFISCTSTVALLRASKRIVAIVVYSREHIQSSTVLVELG